MSVLDNPPLIEAMFDIKWGHVDSTKFEFHPQEEQILTGLIASLLQDKGFTLIEDISNGHRLPHQVTSRFRTEEGKWPCYQSGLGVFTVNQITDGYNWEDFRTSIENALKALSNKLVLDMIQHRKNTKLTLRYQDAFYPEGITTEEYIEQYFNFSSTLPKDFYTKYTENNKYDKLNLQYSIPLADKNGYLTILCANAIIMDKPGILIDFAVEINLNNITESFSVKEIMIWLESAHDIHRHAFTKLIKKEAYVN